MERRQTGATEIMQVDGCESTRADGESSTSPVAEGNGLAHGPVVLRYWGSHFKSLHQATCFAAEYRPMRSRGWSCHLVLERMPANDAWLGELRKIGVRLHYRPRPRRQLDYRSIRDVYALCRAVKATLFHCDNLHVTSLVGAWLAGVPVRVWSKRSMSNHFEQLRAPTLKERVAFTTRLSCRLATSVIALSQAVKEELVSLGVPGSKIVVRGNPRKLSGTGSGGGAVAIRGDWGFSEADVVVLSVAHAVPVKGWDLLLRAFANMASLAPRARLLLVGSHQSSIEVGYYGELTRFIANNRLTDRVVFTGHLGDIRPVLRMADLFVLPSRSEGCANALIEAMDAGLPCVSTRVGNAEEVIADGVNGLLVERGDEAGLTRALFRLVQEDALRRRFRTRAAVPATIPTLAEYAERLAVDFESWIGGGGRERPE